MIILVAGITKDLKKVLNIFEERFWQRCFPLNFAKFLKTCFL